MAISVSWSVHHFGPARNISTATGWIAMKVPTDFHGPERMKPNDWCFLGQNSEYVLTTIWSNCNDVLYVFVQSYLSLLFNWTDVVEAEVHIGQREIITALKLQLHISCPSWSLQWGSFCNCQGQTAHLCPAPAWWHWQNKGKLLRRARLIEAGMVPMMRNLAFCPWCPGFRIKSNASNTGGRMRSFVWTTNFTSHSLVAQRLSMELCLRSSNMSSRDQNKPFDSDWWS